MQALPSIEVLSFLNWINITEYAQLNTDVPVDELFLNDDDHRKYVTRLAERYLLNRQYHDAESAIDIGTEYLDSILAIVRAKAVSQLQREHHYHLDSHDIFNALHRSFYDTVDIFSNSHMTFDRSNQYSGSIFSRNRMLRRGHTKITASELVDSVQAYLIHISDPNITAMIAAAPNSIAYSAISFLHYIENHSKLRKQSLRNIPPHIMESIINAYIWSTYSGHYNTEEKCEHLHSILTQVFINRKYDHYLSNILPMVDFGDVVQRSFTRYVRFKCTILSDGHQIFDFVNRNWAELNEYSADHLDIYYDEKELLNRGYITADKLNIRSKISVYPSLYLWEYDLNKGYTIPINDLEDGELLDVFKAIIDRCCQKESVSTIASSTIELVSQIHHAKAQRKDDEQILTDLLMNACRELQNQRIWHQSEGRSENSRNTFISSLLSQSSFVAKDQTLGGESSTGISIGENDIKIFRNQNEPYAIIEALNLSAPHGKDWHHRNMREHVNRIYKYDTNGLAQNYFLTYVDTPSFDTYWSSLLNEFTITNKCKFGNADFIDVTDLPEQSNTDLRIGVARYRRNGRIVKLYIIAVLMSSHAEIPTSTVTPPSQ